MCSVQDSIFSYMYGIFIKLLCAGSNPKSEHFLQQRTLKWALIDYLTYLYSIEEAQIWIQLDPQSRTPRSISLARHEQAFWLL